MTRFSFIPPADAPQHHPAIETLARYAAGGMRAGFDLVIAAHLRGCAHCRRQLAQFEAVGGSLLGGIEPVAMADRALAATLARLDDPAPAEPAAGGLDRLLAGARRRWVAPGIWVAMIDTPHDPEDRVFLLRVGAGRGTAPHHHDGAEISQVLQGSLSDDGVIYRAGDMVELDHAHVHNPKAAGNRPCICLFATQGRLRPTTLLGRIAFAAAGV